MATVKSFEELEVWKRARVLGQKIFELSHEEPFNHDYSLKNQINSSIGSVVDNIAEGFERGGKNEFIQFLSYSKGSAGEVRYQLYRAFDRKYISSNHFADTKDEILAISKMTMSLINYLQRSEYKGVKYLHEPETSYEIDLTNYYESDSEIDTTLNFKP